MRIGRKLTEIFPQSSSDCCEASHVLVILKLVYVPHNNKRLFYHKANSIGLNRELYSDLQRFV